MTTQPLFPVDLYFQPPAKRADGRRPDVAGHIPYHPEVARALRRSLPRNFHANVPMLALFLAACFRWTGKSTKKSNAGDLSFGKTESQWVDELGISKNQIRLAQKLLCVDRTGKSKGAPNLGLVRCIVRAHRNGVENRYTFLSKQAAQWWLAFGPQPALPLLSTDNPQPLLDEGGSADQPAEGSADQPAEGSADQPAEGSADQPAAPYKHTNKQADKQTTGGGGGGSEWFFKIRTALMGHCVSEPTASRLATALQDSEEWALESIEDTASQIIQSINVQSTPALLVTRLKGQFHLTGI